MTDQERKLKVLLKSNQTTQRQLTRVKNEGYRSLINFYTNTDKKEKESIKVIMKELAINETEYELDTLTTERLSKLKVKDIARDYAEGGIGLIFSDGRISHLVISNKRENNASM